MSMGLKIAYTPSVESPLPGSVPPHQWSPPASGSSSFQEQPGPSCSTLLRLLMLELDSLALHVGSVHTDWVTLAKSLNLFEPHVPQ